MKKSTKNILSVVLSIVITFVFITTLVQSATIISTDISTGGTLSVTGAIYATSTALIDGAVTINDTLTLSTFNATSTTATSTIAGGLDAKDMTVSNIWADTDTSGVLTIGGVGGTNNENLTFDFESTSNRIIISTDTGVTSVQYNLSINIKNNKTISFGNSYAGTIAWDGTGNDSLQIGMSVGTASQSGYVSIVENTDKANANRSPLTVSADPVLRIYSADETEPLDYLEMYHNQTDSVFGYGNGKLLFGNGTATTTIDASGNIGIGTSTPQSKLHVDAGASATTTVEIGDIYSGTGKTCFNIAASDGSAASFFVDAGGNLIVEQNACK